MLRQICRLGLCVFLLGCDRAPADVREWSPTDHDHAPAASAGAQPHAPPHSAPATSPHPPPSPAPSGQAMAGMNQAAMTEWSSRCVRCHGKIGRGDGPQGHQLRARDLSDPEWQGSISDQQIAGAIRGGHAPMPAFDLDEPTVLGLVGLIRLMRRPASAPPGSPP